jgi:predicted alpha/beta superfamily hydrolase
MTLLGTLHRINNFGSKFAASRPFDIWLPPGYFDSANSYPVLYMQDGQNLFDPDTSFSGIPWSMDKAIARLMKTGKIPGVIVVGIWNTSQRRREYMPQKPYHSPGLRPQRGVLNHMAGGKPLSDAYLKFLVCEVKPFVDSNYRTRLDQPHTYIMGSSMGALISLYAISEHPYILFHGAGYVSIHWRAG